MVGKTQKKIQFANHNNIVYTDGRPPLPQYTFSQKQLLRGVSLSKLNHTQKENHVHKIEDPIEEKQRAIKCKFRAILRKLLSKTPKQSILKTSPIKQQQKPKQKELDPFNYRYYRRNL